MRNLSVRINRKADRAKGYLSKTLRSALSKRDRPISAGIFIATLITFWLSPVRGTTDTRYSMLVSQSLLDHGSFRLDYYGVPRSEAGTTDGRVTGGHAYQLELARGHVYYYFPPGSSVLSVPFVAVMNLFGTSAAEPDGSYSNKDEERILKYLAALLMATLAAIFFYTARLMLPAGWSSLIALGGALGTQVWSTASRVVWADTWAILLLGVVVWVLLAHETGRHRLRPALMASLLAWMYFARPTNSIPIAAITIYMLISHRRCFAVYAATGALWFAGFAAYAWVNFGRLLPTYYQAERLQFNNFWLAVVGNLVSPSRGLLIYVPAVLFVAYLLLRYRRTLLHPRLAILSAVIVTAHLLAISGFDTWYGGGCYGPRYTTGTVPLFVLPAVLGMRALLDRARERVVPPRSVRAQLAAGAILLGLSVIINGRGAISPATWKWNVWPVNVDERPERVWEWRYPQFMAGLILPPLPKDAPLINAETRIDFTSREADKFLWYGWSGPEQTQRWSEEREAALVFGMDRMGDISLRMRTGAYVGHGGVIEQQVALQLNGHHVSTLLLKGYASDEYYVRLPGKYMRRVNILRFELPGAKSPADHGASKDQRLLALRVEWMLLEPHHDMP